MVLTIGQINTIKSTIVNDRDRLPAIFSAVSDPTRCRIFRILMVTHGEDVKVGDVAHIMDMSLPAVSRQLKILEMSRLVTREKVGKTVFYKIRNDDSVVRSIVRIIEKEDKEKI